VKKSLFHTEVTKFNVGFQWQIGVFQVEILLKYYEISDKVRLVRTEMLFKFCFWLPIILTWCVPDQGYFTTTPHHPEKKIN
jgi:hypothetical protein